MKKVFCIIVFLFCFSLIYTDQVKKPDVKEFNPIKVNWANPELQGFRKEKIKEDDDVSLEIKNYNFFWYKLKINIETKDIESYQYLEKLWKQFLGIELSLPELRNSKSITFGYRHESMENKLNDYIHNFKSDNEQLKQLSKKLKEQRISNGDTKETSKQIKSLEEKLNYSREAILVDWIRYMRHTDDLIQKVLACYENGSNEKNPTMLDINKKLKKTITTIDKATKIETTTTIYPLNKTNLDSYFSTVKDYKSIFTANFKKNFFDTDRGKHSNISLDKIVNISDANTKTSIELLIRQHKVFVRFLKIRLLQYQDLASNVINSFNFLTYFDKGSQKHNFLIQKIDAFEQAADFCLKGMYKKIKVKGSGKVVSISMIPVDSNGIENDKTNTVKYFVRSKLPISFHVGYAVTNFKWISDGDSLKNEYEKIRSFEGKDFFKLTEENEWGNEVVAFTTLEFDPKLPREKKLCLYGISLGTNLTNPGESIYLGLTAKIKKIFITGGFNFTDTIEGLGKFEEEIVEGVGKRELYESIVKKKKIRLFLAISFSFF